MKCNVHLLSRNTKLTLLAFNILELPDIKCYIHSVSPLKKSSGTSFINCDIQTDSAVVRGVCFATDQKQTLDTLAEQKSPTKITNYSMEERI